MSDSLTSTIDDILAFVQASPFKNQPKQYAIRHFPLDSEEYRELQRLDARFFASCQRAGLSMPHFDSQSTSFKPFGNARIPSEPGISRYDASGKIPTGTQTLLISCTPNWEQAMLGLRAIAEQAERKATGAKQAEGADAARDQGGAAPSVKKLALSRHKALNQYRDAVSKCPNLKDDTDQAVYDWLANHSDGEPLPTFATWSRYLREARKATDEGKNTSRAGRTGRSIVRPDEI